LVHSSISKLPMHLSPYWLFVLTLHILFEYSKWQPATQGSSPPSTVSLYQGPIPPVVLDVEVGGGEVVYPEEVGGGDIVLPEEEEVVYPEEVEGGDIVLPEEEEVVYPEVTDGGEIVLPEDDEDGTVEVELVVDEDMAVTPDEVEVVVLVVVSLGQDWLFFTNGSHIGFMVLHIFVVLASLQVLAAQALQ
jgi:hypothetical protein